MAATVGLAPRFRVATPAPLALVVEEPEGRLLKRVFYLLSASLSVLLVFLGKKKPVTVLIMPLSHILGKFLASVTIEL